MADPGPSQSLDGKNDNKRKWSSNDKKKNKNSPPSKGLTNDERNEVDTTQKDRNMSGIKSFLHGISYQIKLCIFVSLVYAKKSMNPTEKFSFQVTAEDAAAGKFDDIVYTFQDGEKKGRLNIQAKHKFGASAPITLQDLKTTSDTKNPFAILKYFTSYCDQQLSATDMEGFIICTNSDIDDNAMDILQTVEPTVPDDSTASVDSYILTLFERIGGKCYKLDYNKLCTPDGMFSNFYQLLRNCSKCVRLARLLVDAIKSKQIISRKDSLYKQYRQAILEIIERNETSTNDTYAFTKAFLESSSSNSIPGYAAFRKEFENQFKNEFNIDGCVWDDLKQKRVHVSKMFMNDEKNLYCSSGSFPDDNADESFKSFCDRFRLVCSTNNEHALDGAIADLWSNLHVDGDHLAAKGFVEENVVTERLFKTNFDWLMDPFAKPLHSDDLKKDLEKIKNTLAQMKLKGISDKLRYKLARSQFRISHEALNAFDLYRHVLLKSRVEIEGYDMQFGVTVLSDILKLQGKEAIFLEYIDFVKNNSHFHSLPNHVSTLVIICNETDTVPIASLNASIKQVILIKQGEKPSSFSEDLETNFFNCLRIRNITDESWKLFLSEDIAICTTSISPVKVFQNSFYERSVEEVIQLLDWGKHMITNNDIMKKYGEIESTYVHRCWIRHDHTIVKEKYTKNLFLSRALETIHNRKKEKIRFVHLTNEMNQVGLSHIFTTTKRSTHEYKPIPGGDSKKVLILLGEAGIGKSTNLTWLAWDLKKRNPSSWIVRCSLPDHCSDFKPFIQHTNSAAQKVIDENSALRVLYKLAHSSLELERENGQKCSECLVFSRESATLNEEIMKHHDLSLKNSIQLLVFKEKFNAGELVLLLDGFDEIAPHYKEAVLKFLSLFARFNGVSRLYITSRPYSFKEQFQQSLSDASFYQLEPLSRQSKETMLYNMIQLKLLRKHYDDKEIHNFYKSLCYIILSYLGDISDIPLNLMMSVDLLVRLADQYVHIPSKKFKLKLLMEMKRMYQSSFLIDEFVKIKTRDSLYVKIGAADSVANNPREIERFENAIDAAKLQHGLVALWVLLEKSERDLLLSESEIRDAEDYMNKIHEAREKTGIIDELKDGIPVFIHRTVANYLAACWFVKRGVKNTPVPYTLSLWEQNEFRKNVDTILAKNHTLHLAIIAKDWTSVKSLLFAKPQAFNERDDGNRTPLHLLACYWDMTFDFQQACMPKSIESDTINEKDTLFGWTALDYAFYEDKPELIFYLLHHGATINIEALWQQSVSKQFDIKLFSRAARYAKYVMGYLSREAKDYKSSYAYKEIKKYCEAFAIIINQNLQNWSRHEQSEVNKEEKEEVKEEQKEEKTVTEVGLDEKEKKEGEREDVRQKVADAFLILFIQEDSLWMIESMIELVDRVSFTHIFERPYFKLALYYTSMFVSTYLLERDKSLLYDDILLKCISFAVRRDLKNEFKFLFDLYCSQIEIQDFQPCSIERRDDDFFILFENDFHLLGKILEPSNQIFSKIATDSMVHYKILPVLVTCAVMVKPSMLRYVQVTCKLNLCSTLTYYVALIIHNIFSQRYAFTKRKPILPYKLLVNHSSVLGTAEANKMLRLAILSNLFEFAKCVIERYSIDFQPVEEFSAWNSSGSSLSVSEELSHDYDFSNGNFESFCCAFAWMGGFCTCKELPTGGPHDKALEVSMVGKLREDRFKEIEKLDVNNISNLTFCCVAIYQISEAFEHNRSFQTLRMIAEQIAKISLTKQKGSPEQSNSDRLILQAHAEELYQIAMKHNVLYLMYYLHREFRCTISTSTTEADWCSWIAESLRSPNIQLFKWIVRQYCVCHRIALPEGADIIQSFGYDDNVIGEHKGAFDFKIFIKQIDAKLSVYLSREMLCIMQLVVLGICMKHESAVRYLCETFGLNIEHKALLAIKEIAHSTVGKCVFDMPDFDPIFKYLFERYFEFYELDANERNMLRVCVCSVQQDNNSNIELLEIVKFLFRDFRPLNMSIAKDDVEKLRKIIELGKQNKDDC